MGVGLAAPLWLAALAVLVPLIWFYLRTRRRPPALVSSLAVWRAVAEPVVQRRRPRLPLLFFVQAALILASVLALAQPFTRRALPPGPPRDAVVVLDVSASMQARAAGSTRFALARAAAQQRALRPRPERAPPDGDRGRPAAGAGGNRSSTVRTPPT